MSEGEAHGLEAFRGSCPSAPLDARRVAALVDNPGCGRRAVLDAVAAPLNKLAELIGCPPAEQSPFAIAGGIQFEHLVMDNGMAHVVRLAREHLGLEVDEIRQQDLSVEAITLAHGRTTNDLRTQLTKQHLAAALRGADGAVNLIRHPMTRLDLGRGTVCFLEQDVLALAVGGQIHVCEVKSFSCVDGVADPEKVATAMRQAAVYIMSLQDTVQALGFDPTAAVSTKVMLIMATNFTFFPTAAVVDVAVQVRRLRRQLARRLDAAAVVGALPEGVSLPAMPDRRTDDTTRREAGQRATEAVSALPGRFGDGCLSCPMYRFCRREAQEAHAVDRLGSVIANACGEVTTIPVAIELARGRRTPANRAEGAVADLLARARRVSERYGIA